MSTPAPTVPMTVTHDDFVEAITPLLTLLGVTTEDVYNDIHISESGKAGSLASIRFPVVARLAGDSSDHPWGINLDGAPQENAELVHYVSVEVVG